LSGQPRTTYMCIYTIAAGFGGGNRVRPVCQILSRSLVLVCALTLGFEILTSPFNNRNFPLFINRLSPPLRSCRRPRPTDSRLCPSGCLRSSPSRPLAPRSMPLEGRASPCRDVARRRPSSWPPRRSPSLRHSCGLHMLLLALPPRPRGARSCSRRLPPTSHLAH
jgi:hypothetical protein